MIEAFVGDSVVSNSDNIPRIHGQCQPVTVIAKGPEDDITVTNGQDTWTISWKTVFLRFPKEEQKHLKNCTLTVARKTFRGKEEPS